MLRLGIALSVFPALTTSVPASADTSALCDRAAIQASQATGVPERLLLALTRAETGRNNDGTVQPWPWAVNQSGEGYWFETESDAITHVQVILDEGVTNVDIGCFQLNYRWHGASFPSLQAMFDPARNALYAARFLLRLHAETGDWRLAAGAFHSRDADHATPYLARLQDVIDGMTGPPGQEMVIEGVSNPFPLLVSGLGVGRHGSLVPETRGLMDLVPMGQVAGPVLAP
ncbi:transglycosylase SLT domain-containing protein [Neotabrizicola shimadae]|uniref:Transglycosylase SLT domain-containing protein n=1 Tax=Neotabrizicola shimadae TaxID=2807096 RepID=A0A8G1EBV7_9RHOB|nr:transglycosylase SLT domain-containing protein [Neotabrizicola shimadae]QYZ69807.1 transglycosylase SLT domain-containing protein [Neotabrizicola shimadae]